MANRKQQRQRQRQRRNTRRRQNVMRQNMMGGAMVALTPMDLKDTSMVGPSKMSVAQGMDFFGYHSKQHGGAAPVGTTGVLEDGLRGYAHLAPLDKAFVDIAGLKDQTGGRRRKATRKGSRKQRKTTRKATRKGSRKQRKGSRKGTRKMRGGMRELGSMPVDAPGMLLPPSLARTALSNMNQEWKLAENPTSFAPRV